ncbi:hypothetical protein SASPL_153640 [Salvia splendens]|uniref:Uncharacterized protein n=1 Tax=Salvia splendens TaxID=180675 RepID=A0A8X8YXS3_SALSN|nr:hypothetical protein SASPL_153640 [Salvia splendens]
MSSDPIPWVKLANPSVISSSFHFSSSSLSPATATAAFAADDFRRPRITKYFLWNGGVMVAEQDKASCKVQVRSNLSIEIIPKCFRSLH